MATSSPATNRMAAVAGPVLRGWLCIGIFRRPDSQLVYSTDLQMDSWKAQSTAGKIYRYITAFYHPRRKASLTPEFTLTQR